MTVIAFTFSARRAAGALTLAVTVGLLNACGGTTTVQVPVVTVTLTPAETAGGATVPGQGTFPKSDVRGRKFDLGTIVQVKDDRGVPVIIFDRWTVRGVPDATLAAKGVPIGVHSDAPYQNLNSKVTYRIPVAQGAVFVYRHCLAVDQPAAQSPSTLEDFARLQDAEKVTLLTLDQHGRVFSAQNDPAC